MRRAGAAGHADETLPFIHSKVGGAFPLPIITEAPSLDTSSIVKKIVAGPGGYTRPFGGVVNVNDFLSSETVASMKTSRAPVWKPWVENPRSMSDTNFRQ